MRLQSTVNKKADSTEPSKAGFKPNERVGERTQYRVAVLQVLDPHLDVLDGEVKFKLLELQERLPVALVRLAAEVHLRLHVLWRSDNS